MQFIDTNFQGLLHFAPKVFSDSRGVFLETFNERDFEKFGIPNQYVQDNQSFSKKGVLRGLHLQRDPHAQGKLVRVAYGEVLDVVVDLRKGSLTFGQSYKCILNSENNHILYVPEGFAHGFYAARDSVFLYKCTNHYHSEAELGIKWNDEELNIGWNVRNPLISEKDKLNMSFEEYKALISV